MITDIFGKPVHVSQETDVKSAVKSTLDARRVEQNDSNSTQTMDGNINFVDEVDNGVVEREAHKSEMQDWNKRMIALEKYKNALSAIM